MEVRCTDKLFDFSEKNILVTGSSKGIGAGIAKRFAEAGANVAVHYNSSLEAAQAIADLVKSFGGKTALLKADIRTGSGASSLFDAFDQYFDSIDILVNNAGSFPTANILEMSEAEWDDMLDTNLKSVFLCTQQAARRMVKTKIGGAIINISSLSAVNPAIGHTHYTAAKAGVKMFTMTAAMELGKYGIRVNAVGPGLINSPGLSQNWPEGLASWNSKVPLGRVGESIDIADACLFLASDASRFITGEHILVDGGMFTHPLF
jgi:NAD(P)-dependent dehydrogenase (short-subunit alcohol dehydrogenase family)